MSKLSHSHHLGELDCWLMVHSHSYLAQNLHKQRGMVCNFYYIYLHIYILYIYIPVCVSLVTVLICDILLLWDYRSLCYLIDIIWGNLKVYSLSIYRTMTNRLVLERVPISFHSHCYNCLYSLLLCTHCFNIGIANFPFWSQYSTNMPYILFLHILYMICDSTNIYEALY